MDGFQPDRKPQQMARMLAMQERNRSLNAPGNNMQNVPQPNQMYSGATPNVNPGIPPQAGMMGRPPAPQIGGMRPRAPRGPGAMGYPQSPGMTTPQGGNYRGDFENAS